LQVTTCGALLRNSSSLNGLSETKQKSNQLHFEKLYLQICKNIKNIFLIQNAKKKLALVPATKKDLDVNAFLFLVATGHFWIGGERERWMDRVVKMVFTISEMRNTLLTFCVSLGVFIFIFYFNAFVSLSLTLFVLRSETKNWE
jgi:hypothetical protein